MNYSPRNSSAGPTVRKDPNTSDAVAGSRGIARDAARGRHVGRIARGSRRPGGSRRRELLRDYGARPVERREDPQHRIRRRSVAVMPRMSLSPRIPHTAMVRRARQRAQVRGQTFRGGYVVRHVENPFDRSGHDLEPAMRAARRAQRLRSRAEPTRRPPKPAATSAASAAAALPIWCLPGIAGRARFAETDGAESEIPAIGMLAHVVIAAGRDRDGARPRPRPPRPTAAGLRSPSTAGRPARKMPAFSRPISSSVPPNQST